MPVHSAADLVAIVQAQYRSLEHAERSADAMYSIACASVAAVVGSGNQSSAHLLRLVVAHPLEAPTTDARFLQCVLVAKLVTLAAAGAVLALAWLKGAKMCDGGAWVLCKSVVCPLRLYLLTQCTPLV